MVQSRDAAHRNGFPPRPAFVACGGAFSTRTPVPRTGRTRSEARFCFVAGNCDTACLTPRLTDRGIALAFACPISRSCATAARSACVTAIYPARKAGMASKARDSRCPTPVYPMPIRTAPTVNFVAPDATRQGRSLSSLLHFARRLPSPSRRNAPAADPGSSAIGGRFRTYRRSPPFRKARLFSSPRTPAGGSHPSTATLARGPGTSGDEEKVEKERMDR